MQNKPGFVAGEGHAYLKSPMWWTGMTCELLLSRHWEAVDADSLAIIRNSNDHWRSV